MADLKHVVTCKSEGCEGLVFYDWGLEVLSNEDTPSIKGGTIERWDGFAKRNAVKVCARCLTPYILEAGDLIDITEYIGPEEIELIIQRGKGSVVPPVVRDP